MRLLSFGLALAVSLLAASYVSANTIAITEIFEHPVGERTGRNWIELFNYGKEPVKLNSWKIVDENEQICDLPEYTIPSGGYIILVFGSIHTPSVDKKRIFEMEWLGGKEDDRVFGVSNTSFEVYQTDQVVIRNNRRQTVWGLAWKNDGKAGKATWWAMEKFVPRIYGTKAKPGVVRKGNDFDITGGDFPGYEINDLTPDPEAYESDPSKLEKEFGERFKLVADGGKCDKGMASPLKGIYKVP